jgi:hypothetical protein
VAPLLAPAAATALPISLLNSTVQAATGTVSAGVAALTEGVFRAMFPSKLKTALILVVTAGTLAFAAGAFAYRPGAPGPTAPEADVRKAAADARAEDETWGKEVGGIQARLRSAKVVWTVEERPTLSLDVRNRGDAAVRVGVTQELAELEVDCKWYWWGEDVDLEPTFVALAAGQELKEIARIVVTGPWVRMDGFRLVSPELTPGKHEVRVRFQTDGGQVVSNPVAIEIVAGK